MVEENALLSSIERLGFMLVGEMDVADAKAIMDISRRRLRRDIATALQLTKG